MGNTDSTVGITTITDRASTALVEGLAEVSESIMERHESVALEIDRRDFGVSLQRMADSAPIVGNDVKITFDVEFGRRVTS